MNHIESKILEELKETLQKEKALLISELKTIAKPDDRPLGNWKTIHTEFSPDEIMSEEALENDENADESEEDAKNEALTQHLEIRLKEVNSALERIEKGTYGICEKCQKPIAIERLRANPAAKTDIEHAR